MPIPVFVAVEGYPTRVRRRVNRRVFDLGAGYLESVQNEAAHSRADGTGSVSAYRGVHEFEIELPACKYSDTAGFASVLDFLQARVDAGDESFYWYFTPTEAASADPTGAATTGRYLVKCLDDLEFVLQFIDVYKFGTIRLREVFS